MINKLPVILCLREHDHSVELDCLIQTGLIWFRGHFPGSPVLPGVVQLHWALQFANRYFDLDQSSASQHTVKFRRIIQPEQKVTLQLEHDIRAKRLKFKFFDDRHIYSSGTFVINPTEAPRL